MNETCPHGIDLSTVCAECESDVEANRILAAADRSSNGTTQRRRKRLALQNKGLLARLKWKDRLIAAKDAAFDASENAVARAEQERDTLRAQLADCQQKAGLFSGAYEVLKREVELRPGTVGAQLVDGLVAKCAAQKALLDQAEVLAGQLNESRSQLASKDAEIERLRELAQVAAAGLSQEVVMLRARISEFEPEIERFHGTGGGR